jgi:RsiW-degrading membrane proteinase PrsW (M82 family)
VDDLQFFILLAGLSILPSLLFAAWVRNHETHSREPWGAVLRAFLFGAIVGTTVALLLNTLFQTASYYYGLDAGLAGGFLTAVVAAPFIEEATKGAGLGLQRKRILELEDGLVYGAAIGLGFAATENLFYGLSAWFDEGSGVAVQTVVIRALSSTILHAGASALLGFGYAKAVLRHDFGAAQVIPYYLLAVAIHAAYNLLVSLESWAGFILAIIMVWFILARTRRQIKTLDTMPHEVR